MCGIVGVVDLRGDRRLPDPACFDRMVDSLARRGPDGRGVWRADDVLLGHRRLAILDPSAAADQPMHRDGAVVVFNGEIYNFRALRSELERLGHTFSTSGDTEVLLAAWKSWGERCVERLNGIFAFVVVDGPRVFLARDHIGIKPLFYRLHEGLLWFGSELKSILADPRVPRRPSPEAIDCFLTQAWVPSPLTPFEGIEQLPPASTLSLTLESSSLSRSKIYWRPATGERRISLKDAVVELGARLDDAVTAQMVSDVPLGAFLSGGLDSASVVAAMRKRGPVRSFSMGFAQGSFDESSDAAHTAHILGSDHHKDVVDLELERCILNVADTNDDLLADASLLAVDRLCALTRRHVTVALSGDGADEILAGYPTYAATHVAQAWRQVPSPLRALVNAGAAHLPVSVERYNLRDFALRFLSGAERGPGNDFASWRIYFDDDVRRRLLRPAFAAEGRAIARYAAAVNDAPAETLLKKLLVADLTHYLPGDMLVKVDRASMRHGLEVRVPFLDPRFVDFALSLPSHLLLSPTGTTKRVLRAHVEQQVSRRIGRGKKRGFNVPVSAALRGPLVPLFLDAITAEPFRSEGPIDVDVLLLLLEEHRSGRHDWGYPLYAALVLALWWQRFVANVPLVG